jgi:protein ImuB
MRLACLFIPQLPLQAALRRWPELRGTTVALTVTHIGRDGRRSQSPAPVRGAAPRIVAVSAEARRAGVRPGLTAAQGMAACVGLSLLPMAEVDVAAADAALGDLGFGFAPRIEREPGRVFLQVDDLGALYPSETALAQTIAARALRVGLGIRVAIAAHKSIARIATRAGERVLVPGGGESAALAPLPVRLLGEPLSPTLTETFARWGIATIGAFAALPASEVSLRLGTEGARLHRLARGEDDEPFLPALPADAIEEALGLDEAITELEPLAFVLRGLFERVLARLACRSLACAGITLRLRLDSRAFDLREIQLAAPTREAAPLLQLARLDLARRPPDAPITELLVVARPARVRAAQLDLLRPAGPAPDRLAATIARLAALVGPENVGAPRCENTWREEAVGLTTFQLSPPAEPARASHGRPRTPAATANANATPPTPKESANATETETGQPALNIRRFRPPEEIEVMVGPDGPMALRGKETTARILVAAGPYRLSSEWWQSDAHGHNGFSRDYWDVHASDGAIYRLHHDRHHDRWFLDGYYD